MPFLTAIMPGAVNTSSLPSTGIVMPAASQNQLLMALLQNPNQAVAASTAKAIIAQDAIDKATPAPTKTVTTVAPPPVIQTPVIGQGDTAVLEQSHPDALTDSYLPAPSFMSQYGVWVGVGVAGALLLGVVLYKRHQRQAVSP